MVGRPELLADQALPVLVPGPGTANLAISSQPCLRPATYRSAIREGGIFVGDGTLGTRWSGLVTRVANQVPVASDKVLVKIEEVVGVEGDTIEFAGRLVLLLHHKPRCLLGNDLCNDRPRCWFVLVWEIGTGTDVPSNRWMDVAKLGRRAPGCLDFAITADLVKALSR